METILTIDASVDPIELVILRVDRGASSVPASETVSIVEAIQVHKQAEIPLAQTISYAAEQLQQSWETALLIVDGGGHISFNINLPFSDSKKVAKLIAPEVQDLLPFDLEESVLSYGYVGITNDSQSDFHIQVLPLSELSELLSGLKGTRCEPRIVTTPGNLLAGLYEFFKRDLEENSVVIFETDTWLYAGVIIGGKLVTERSVEIKKYLGGEDYTALSGNQLAALLESAILAVEERYTCALPLVYRIAQTAQPQYAPPVNRSVHELSMVTLFPRASTKVSLLHLLAIPFAREYPAPKIPGNFRSGPLVFTPSWREAIIGGKQLLPLFIVLLVVSILSAIGWYAAREYTAIKLRETLSKSILAEVPTFTAESGQEAKTLQTMSQSLQDALKELGSPLAAPPLNVLTALSEDIASIDGVTVNRVSIRNGEVKVDGSVPNYNKLNKLEDTLKKRNSLFCKSKTDSPTTGSRNNTRDFQLTLTLCEA